MKRGKKLKRLDAEELGKNALQVAKLLLGNFFSSWENTALTGGMEMNPTGGKIGVKILRNPRKY